MKMHTSDLKGLSCFDGELLSLEVPLLVYFDIGRSCSCNVMCTDNRMRQAVGAVDIKMALEALAKGGVKRVIFRGDYFYRQDGIFELSMYGDSLGLESWFFVNGKIIGFHDEGIEDGERSIAFMSDDFMNKRAELFGTDMCGAGRLSCYINSCGSISLCPDLPLRVGNIREDDFFDVWRNSAVLSRFRRRLDYPPACKGCELYV